MYVARSGLARAAVVAAAATALWLTAPAFGGSDPNGACRATPCAVKLKVGPDEMKWRSIETFYPYNEQVKAILWARGIRMREVERWGPGNCRAAYRGSGIVAIVKACGDATPLRVRAYRMKRRRIGMVVGYRGVPIMGS